ncbi:MAG: dihydrolipoyl dehydrogenase [Thermodesulfobacteriota bacterium]
MAPERSAADAATSSPYDLVVIGAGPGGYVAAIRAGQLGMRVACVDKDPALGGTCLNVGCIPSKALLHSSELYEAAAKHFAEHGIEVGSVSVDLPTMMKRKTRVVTTMTRGIAGLFKKNKVEQVVGTARIVKAGRVVVTDGDGGERTLETRAILIASGSVPIALPGLPFDGKRVVDSTSALELPAVPGELAVVGAGAIGLELGSVWRRLGSKVTVIELTPGAVPGMDREMAKLLERSLAKQGLAFRFDTRVETASLDGERVRLTLRSGDGKSAELGADVVLVAVGRRAYPDLLGLEQARVAVDERGRVVVDERFATNVPGIHAIGDVIAGPMLAHKAEEEGIACVELLAGKAGHVNYDAIPNVVYTFPELASVGLSEEAAKARGLDVRVGRFPFAANGRAKTMGEMEGQVKVVADAKTDRLLGVHVLGSHASDLIAEAAVAIEFGASAEDIARSVHAHPTLPEAMKEAALAVDGRAIHV